MLRLIRRVSMPTLAATVILLGGLLHSGAAVAQVVSGTLPGNGAYDPTTFKNEPTEFLLVIRGGAIGPEVPTTPFAPVTGHVTFTGNWMGQVTITGDQDSIFSGADRLFAGSFSEIVHNVGPHGEGVPGPSFSFSIDSRNDPSGTTRPGGGMHGTHEDSFSATLTYELVGNQITSYTFTLAATHAPEPATWALFAAGMLPVLGAAVIRKRRAR